MERPSLPVEARLKAEHDCTAILAAATSFQYAAPRLLEAICQRLGWEVGVIWLVDKQAQVLRCHELMPRPGFEDFEAASRQQVFSSGDGLPGRVWSSREGVWVPNLAEEVSPRFFATTDLGLRSAIAIPIITGKELVGVLEFFGTQMLPPDPPLLQMLESISSQIGECIRRERLEGELRQVQKMEAIGRLAGGVAHDFNNLLTVIIGFSDMALEMTESNDPKHELLSEIKKAGERAATLTRQLLAFSRKQVLEPAVIDLNELVADMQKMLGRLIGEDINMAFCPAAKLWRVKADCGQIEQVIMNLVVNARDAMPQGGRLTIETDNVYLDEQYVAAHPDAQTGKHVLLAISDSGCGMDAATRERVFEPFFTTKALNQGTGLGLAMVYGIVRQSGGHIEVYSELNKGTTFKVYLPRAHDFSRPSSSHDGRAVPPRGDESILLVEDEDAVRSLAATVLQKQGYSVLAARNGDEALRRCEQHLGDIDLIATDLVMPGMSGRELAERVQAMYPGTKLLYMSGYADDAVVRHGVLESHLPFLQKPYTPDVLARKVREALDAKPRTSTDWCATAGAGT